MKAVPVRERHTLQLIWPVTPSIKEYKKGASSYLSHLLGHEADGSLYALVKTLGQLISEIWVVLTGFVDCYI